MRKLSYGMVGGGPGALIGARHRAAAQRAGLALVAGVFSRNPGRSRAFAKELGLASGRAYPDFETLIRAESSRPPADRIAFVLIATPNDTHVDYARRALEAGFPVVCDKPLARSLVEAKTLVPVIEKTQLPFAITYNYAAYPAIRAMQGEIRAGKLGSIRKVHVHYLQGWLSDAVEAAGNKQAIWRTDPSRSGIAGTLADIGTHAFHLVEHTTGLRVRELAAEVRTFVPNRQLDDDANVLLRFENGATGTLNCSQVAWGERNELEMRIYGEKGGFLWRLDDPLAYRQLDADHPQTVRCEPDGDASPRIEAFAAIYREFAAAVSAKNAPAVETHFPGLVDGLRGMAFVEAAVNSGRAGARWQSLADARI